MTKIKKEKTIREGSKLGGFYIPSPWDNEVPLLIEEAIVRKFGKELWAEHIKPQYDYTEVKDTKEWIKYLK